MIEPHLENEINTRFGKVEKLDVISGGGNHSLLRVDTSESSYALKIFNRRRPQVEDKFHREVWGMKFFNQCGINVPSVVNVYPEFSALLMEYVPTDTPTQTPEIVEFVDFIKRANHSGVKDTMPESLGNGLDVDHVFLDCENRIKRLHGAVSEREEVWSTVLEIKEQLYGLKGTAKSHCAIGPIVSAGDFGRHNTITSSGRCFFIDFEYCGVDDLSKVIMDFIIHPGQDLNEHEVLFFFEAISRWYQQKEVNLNTLDFFYELYSLRWSLIVLNPFLSQYSDRNAELSGSGEEEFQVQQLSKAKEYLKNAKDFNFKT